MTPGNIQRRKYPQRASLRDGPRASLKCESTAARVSRQYRAAGPRLGSVWHPDELSVQDLVDLNDRALAGRAGLWDGQPPELPRVGRVGRVWHSVGLPQVLPHASPGAEPHDAHAGSVEGCPRAGARSGYARPTGCHTTPSVKIVGDHAELMIVRTLYGHKTHPDNPKMTAGNERLQLRKSQVVDVIHEQPQQWSENPWILSHPFPGPKSSMLHAGVKRRLTASHWHCDGASTTIDTTNTANKAARTRKVRRAPRDPASCVRCQQWWMKPAGVALPRVGGRYAGDAG